MRVADLKTLPANFMFWDKDFCRYATIDDIKKFVEIEENIYGTDYEMRLQCLGRFRRLAYTGMNDKNDRPIYEGHIVKASYKIMEKKITFVGVVGFEKAGFVIIDAKYDATILSAYEPEDLRIVGNIFENPELVEVKNGCSD